MAESRIYLALWGKLFKQSKKVSTTIMKPGNFYKIQVYKYADPVVTKTLAGVDTAYIFLIGKYKGKDEKGLPHYYFPALKLKHINPRNFFTALDAATDSISEKKIDESEEFRLLLRQFPLDGKPLFTILKKKPLIYEGNYREYRMASIRSVEELEIDKEYLKIKMIRGYSNEKKIEEEKKLDKPKETPQELKKQEKVEKILKQKEINLEPQPKSIVEKIEVVNQASQPNV